jgi:hypothetical protein
MGFVAGVIWYELFDRGRSTSCDPEDHFGLFYHDLTPKPAATSLGRTDEPTDTALPRDRSGR